MAEPEDLSALLDHASGIRLARGAPSGALDDLRRTLAASFRFGQSPADIGSARPVSRPSAVTFPDVAAAPAEPLRIARRDSEIRDTGLPDWALGMRPSRSIGPFVDETGAAVAFEVFDVVPHVRVFQGVEVLELPGGTTLDPGGASLTIPAGTVWILGARLTAAAPPDAWTGILVKGGSLAFPPGSLFLDGTLSVPAGLKLTLTIELDPPVVPAPAAGPGAEAGHSNALLPETATLVFGPLGIESIAADAASLTVFGNAVALERNAAAPYYEPALRMVIIPLDPDVPSIEVNAVQSTLFQPAGKADIVKAGWALTVTQSQPENLGAAIGSGSLMLELEPGLETTWEGLQGGPTLLGRTLVLVDPALLRIVSPAAVNFRGDHPLELWRNRNSASERSILDVRFPVPFLLWLISQRDGLDGVLAEPHLSGHFDRPVKADGEPFPVEIDGSLLILQKPEGVTVGSEAFVPQGAFRPALAAALSNALLTITPPQRLFFHGSLTSGSKVEDGTLLLIAGVYQILPILPDPYAANFDPAPNRDAPLQDSEVRATVTWPDRDHPALDLSFTLHDGAVADLLPRATRDGIDRDIDQVQDAGPRAVYWMLDVSTGADLLGVSLDVLLARPEQQRLTIADLSIQAAGERLHTFMLPQFQWEPVHNTANPRTGDTQKTLSSSHDGGPAFIGTETVHLIPVAPIPVVNELIRAYSEDQAVSRARFTLPFGMEAFADLSNARYRRRPGLNLIAAPFEKLTGARQIRITPGSELTEIGPLLHFRDLLAGHAFQTDNFAATGPPFSTLGQLKDDFNASFTNEIPIERIDLSGYGASIFSRWLRPGSPDVGVTQVGFDGFNGRTSYERVLMVSVLWPCLARMVRTIILERQGSGAVLRWDSGWLATSPGLFKHPRFTGVIHTGVVAGMANIREVRDTDQFISVDGLDLQAVYYDADIAFAAEAPLPPVIAGQNSVGLVPARRQLGFIQRIHLSNPLVPAESQAQVLSPQQFAKLLVQSGPLGGPVDCTIRIGASAQTQRVTSIETARGGARTAFSAPEFAVAANGSPVLPAAGRWTVVRVNTAEKTVGAADAQRGVPLIRSNDGPYRWADPEDLLHEAAAKSDYALMMAHDTQRLLVQRPKIEFGGVNISTTVPPRVADPYSMLASTGMFPRVDQGIQLPAGTELLPETLTLAGGTLDLPAGGLGLAVKPLVNLTSWKETADFAKAALHIDSLDDWKIHLKDVQQRLEYDGLGEIMTVVHDFESVAGDASKFLEPEMIFGPEIQAVADVLQTLRQLAPVIGGPIGPFKLEASFKGTTFLFSATADFKLATGEDNAVECGMGKAKGDLQIGAELSADIIKRDIRGSVFLEISGSWQQEIFPFIYGGGHLRFSIRADQSGKTTLELDACTMGSIGGTLIPGLVDVEATVKYGYFIQIVGAKVRPGLVASMEGRAKLLSGLLGFKFGVEGRVLIYPEFDPGAIDRSGVRLFGRIRVAGTVTVAWLIEESKSFETDFEEKLNWKTVLFAVKAGLVPVP